MSVKSFQLYISAALGQLALVNDCFDSRNNYNLFMTFQDYKNLKYFNNLDGLRGVSIFMVVLHHVTIFNNEYIRQFQLNGNKGVWLFFIISGYLISTLLLREHDRKGKINLKNFLIRRGLRLYPLYYGMLSLYFLLLNIPYLVGKLNFAQKQALFNDKLLSYIFYYSNFNSHSESLAPFYFSWSLSAEEQFYLLFSIALYFLGTKVLGRILPILLILKLIFFYLPLNFTSFGKSMLLPLDLGIMFGVSLGFILHYEKSWNIFSSFLKSKPLFILSVVGAFYILFTKEITFPQETFFFLLILFMTYIFGHLLLSGRNNFFESKLVNYIGRISYGIYMYNLLVIRIVQKIMGKLGIVSGLAELALTCILTFMIAHFSFKYFESYFNNMKSRFSA